MTDYFRNRKLWIITKHGKEKLIGPLFEKELGIIPELLESDTDVLGTFSGEIPRTEDPVNTLRKKCRLAFEKSDADLVIASEGSFGMHPIYYFIPADEEWLMLMDKKNNLEIFTRVISTETNFFTSEVNHLNELEVLLDKMIFPSHGVILRIRKNDKEDYVKGIHDSIVLFREVENAFHSGAKVILESDMRANHNPTRMKIIHQTALKLLERIKSICPNCSTPGFGVVNSIKGLPCNQCGLPTKSVLYDICTCQKCNYSENKYFPFGKQKENPQFCQFCNP